jgi:hypothetical protein
VDLDKEKASTASGVNDLCSKSLLCSLVAVGSLLQFLEAMG